MHIKRIYLILGMITIMAFVTAWMQMQIVRQGYTISEIVKAREQAINEQKKLRMQVISMKTPQNLVPPGREKTQKPGMIMPEVITLDEFNKRVNDSTAPPALRDGRTPVATSGGRTR